MKYLLDTNICIYYMKGLFGLDEKFKKAGYNNCCISEITLAELKFGVENSEHKEKKQAGIRYFYKWYKNISHH